MEDIPLPLPESSSIDMMKAKYGEKFQEYILEQYKLYVEMADRVSARRGQMNSFYISLLSGLLALISIVIDKKILSDFSTVTFLTVSILGIILCFLWQINIHSYGQLTRRKFKIIQEMELCLPFPCYKKEQLLWEKDKGRNYIRQTSIEKYIAFTLGIPYLGLLIYSIFSFFR